MGCEISRDEKGNIYMTQSGYITSLAKKAGIDLNCEIPMETPLPPLLLLPEVDETRLLIGDAIERYASLVGATTYTLTVRPDVAYAVSLMSKRMTTPTELHKQLLDGIVMYLYQTREIGLRFEANIPLTLEAHADASYRDDKKNQR